MPSAGVHDLVQRVGAGGAGTVWSAWHRPTGQRVAVKVLDAGVAHDELFVRSFRNEVRAAARLDHPHVVRVLDHGRITRDEARPDEGLAAGAPWLAMEWADGGHLRPEALVRWEEVADLALALLSALAHAHARGVVHRDLKPGNILVAGPQDPVPGPRLSDFAISARRTQGPEGLLRLGTPEYLPPERLRQTWWDESPASDLYALGLVLWKALTGELPHGGTGAQEVVQRRLAGRIQPLAPRFPVPDGLEAWLRTLLSPSPRTRPKTAAQAARGLLALGPLAPVSGRAPTSFERRLARAAAEGGAILPSTWRLEPPPPPRPVVGTGRLDLRPLPTLARQAERDALWEALVQVRSGDAPRLVLLHGPSGVGKSHLALWLAEMAEELGAAEVLHATHDAARGPQHGLGPMLARWLRVLGLPQAQALPAIQARLDQHGVEATDVTLAMAALLHDELEPAPEAHPPARRFQHPQERHALLRGLLEGLGRRSAVVLVLDDLQWGSEAVSLLRSLLEGPPLPVLALATWSTDQPSSMPSGVLETLLSGPRVAGLPIGPLGEEDQRRLLREVLGLADDLVARVEARAAGNVSYVVQLVETWVQRGALLADPRGWTLAEGVTVEPPRGARAAWRGRIEPLLAGWPPHAVEALELGAFLGLDVTRSEWRAACDSLGLPEPAALLDALAEAGLLTLGAGPAAGGEVEGAPAPGTAWTFAHAMLRDALVERAQEAGRARRHHQVCARALVGSGEPGHAARLGRHLVAAGEVYAALVPLADAAEAAMDAGEYARAEVLLGERDAALRQAELAESDPRWARGWLLWCRLRRVTGADAQVTELASRVVEQGQRHGWGAARVTGLVLLARTALRQGRPDQARACLDEADRAVHGSLEDPSQAPALLAEVRRCQGIVLARQGALAEADACLSQALAVLGPAADPLRRGGALLDRAHVARQRGDVELAQALALEAQEAYRVVGSRWGVANARNQLGEVARQRGDLDAAIEHYRQAARRHAEVSTTLSVVPRVNLGLALLAAGQLDPARQELVAVLGEVGAAAGPEVGGTCQAALAVIAAERGDWQATLHHLAMCEQHVGGPTYVDRDLAALLERVAQAAQRAGRPVEADLARRQAREQRQALDPAGAGDAVL
ncbi:protein kinase [Myxococcota bacterium]|nr:protein kinase [Myxococcota bacterium]